MLIKAKNNLITVTSLLPSLTPTHDENDNNVKYFEFSFQFNKQSNFGKQQSSGVPKPKLRAREEKALDNQALNHRATTRTRGFIRSSKCDNNNHCLARVWCISVHVITLEV